MEVLGTLPDSPTCHATENQETLISQKKSSVAPVPKLILTGRSLCLLTLSLHTVLTSPVAGKARAVLGQFCGSQQGCRWGQAGHRAVSALPVPENLAAIPPWAGGLSLRTTPSGLFVLLGKFLSASESWLGPLTGNQVGLGWRAEGLGLGLRSRGMRLGAWGCGGSLGGGLHPPSCSIGQPCRAFSSGTLHSGPPSPWEGQV